MRCPHKHIVLLACSSWVSCAQFPTASTELRLEELWATQLPATFDPTGAQILSDSSMLTWSRSTGAVLIVRPGGREPVCAGQVRAPIAAQEVNTGEIRILDASGPAVVTGTPNHRCSREPLPVDLEVFAGTLGESWLALGGLTSDGAPVTVVVVGPTGDQWMVASDGSRGDPRDGRSSHLTAADPQLLLTSMHWPFAWEAREVRTGSLVARGSPLSGSVAGRRMDSVHITGWVSLSTLRLDHVFLQTLVDPTSDSRLILTYGLDGELWRWRDITAPIAFISADSGQHLVLAVRTSDTAELVVYRWRWLGIQGT